MAQLKYAERHRLLGLCRTCPRPLANGSNIFCEYHRVNNRARERIRDRKSTLVLKQECVNHYGGKCSCCGEILIEFLSLDHINGNGNIHRKFLFKHNVGGSHMYRWLKKNNFPEGYRLLCMNCNWAMRYRKECPHKQNFGGVT